MEPAATTTPQTRNASIQTEPYSRSLELDLRERRLDLRIREAELVIREKIHEDEMKLREKIHEGEMNMREDELKRRTMERLPDTLDRSAKRMRPNYQGPRLTQWEVDEATEFLLSPNGNVPNCIAKLHAHLRRPA